MHPAGRQEHSARSGGSAGTVQRQRWKSDSRWRCTGAYPGSEGSRPPLLHGAVYRRDAAGKLPKPEASAGHRPEFKML